MTDDSEKDSKERDAREPVRVPDPTLKGAFIGLLSPIPLTVLLILVSVFVLMYPSVFSDSDDVLTRMADHEFARGVITYLFAVTTIGTAVVLVLAALTGALAKEEQYTRGKDILGLLIGVFGTIVGFYFGSEAHSASDAVTPVSVSQPLILDSLVSPGDSVRLTAFVSGGTPPYTWGVTTDRSGDIEYDNTVDSAGWIVARLRLPANVTEAEVALRLGVRDGAGNVETRQSVVRIRPAPPRP